MKCPCQSQKNYSDCCEKYHKSEATAPTAEILMRSRYSAYALDLGKYIYKTWDSSTRPSKKSLTKHQGIEWLGLTIIRTESGSLFDTEGIVEFTARFNSNGEEQSLHEVSRFIRHNGKWVYLDGKHT